jgi:hypothetical protein
MAEYRWFAVLVDCPGKRLLRAFGKSKREKVLRRGVFVARVRDGIGSVSAGSTGSPD